MADKQVKPRPVQDPDVLRSKKEEQNRRARRRNRQLIGIALTILIVVGAVSIVDSAIGLVRNMMDDSAELATYNTRVTPIVWFDLLPFESLSQVDEDSLKQVCIWGVYNQKTEAGETMERDELGAPYIPVADVDRYAAALFGPDFRFTEHGSFEYAIEQLSYTYDADKQTYSLPPTGLTPDFVPNVVEIQRESGGVKRVIVGYVSTRTSDDKLIDTPDLDHPAKYMDFMFRRDGNEYYLYALHTDTDYVPPSAPGESSVAAVVSDASDPQAEDSSFFVPSRPAVAVDSGAASDASAGAQSVTETSEEGEDSAASLEEDAGDSSASESDSASDSSA